MYTVPKPPLPSSATTSRGGFSLRSSEAASTGDAAEAGAGPGVEAVGDVVADVEGKSMIDAAAARWAPADSRHFWTKEAARCCGRP